MAKFDSTNVVQLRFRRRSPKAKIHWPNGSFSPIMVVLPLVAFTGVLLWDGWPGIRAVTITGELERASVQIPARFNRCIGAVRTSCVVDGDTFWLNGEKIRIADINAPETLGASCPYELALGEAARHRLIVLLSEGSFELKAGAQDRDRFGRLLRTVMRGNRSIGDQLVSEGLAERWRGSRGDWCGSALFG